MYRRLFEEFLAGKDSLRVYQGDKLVFASEEDGLLPLLEYIEKYVAGHRQVVMFDKIMGNAAALLSVKAHCCEVFNPLGSQLAVKTLDRYGVKYHISEIVPYIQKPGQEEMCPMEMLSLDKTPEEFYEAVKRVMGRP